MVIIFPAIARLESTWDIMSHVHATSTLGEKDIEDPITVLTINDELSPEDAARDRALLH